MARQLSNPIKFLIIGWFMTSSITVSAQEKGQLSGDLQFFGNLFLRDSAIGAFGFPQYEEQFAGSDIWLNLTYAYDGYEIGLRFDAFNNSNLRNPSGSFTGQGIGRWYIKKQLDRLHVSVGYLYDQVGTGAIFRAYEQRPLFIDQALIGMRLRYNLTDDLQIKLLAGRQRNIFEIHESYVKVGNLDYFKYFENGLSLAPGIGVTNRTLSGDQMDNLVNILQGYVGEERFSPKFNVYAMTAYNNLSFGGFNWYIEAAYKSEDSFFNPDLTRDLGNGEKVTGGRFVSNDGLFIYTSIGQSIGRFSVNLEYKRTENFELRTDPTLQQFDGLMNYFPPMSRQNTYQLTARYIPAFLFLGEQAFQGDIRYAPSRKLNFLLNFSHINDLEGVPLYREIFTQVNWKMSRTRKLIAGVQLQRYDRLRYEQEGEGFVETLIPYLDFLYKFDKRKSVRVEAQYMYTGADIFGHDFRDFGDWLYGLVEVGIAPNWIFTASSMYNINPFHKGADGEVQDQINYPSIGAVYLNKGNRYGLRYVKQVEGVVCSGGICRLEPAFSGIRLEVNSTF